MGIFSSSIHKNKLYVTFRKNKLYVTFRKIQCGLLTFSPEALTKHQAVEWGPNGVRVVCVAPGPIEDTEGMKKLSK